MSKIFLSRSVRKESALFLCLWKSSAKQSKLKATRLCKASSKRSAYPSGVLRSDDKSQERN